jgi:demethylmenaquinone methyltransferase / 2-methoxy-6-polyprenyl-1,4-benzoquinol methylase
VFLPVRWRAFYVFGATDKIPCRFDLHNLQDTHTKCNRQFTKGTVFVVSITKTISIHSHNFNEVLFTRGNKISTINYICTMSMYQHDVIVPLKNSTDTKKKQVEEMFDKIAFRYDFLNHFLSAGIDTWWRKKAISQLISISPKRILDVATGTGDVAILSYKMLQPEKITGIDISEGMLQVGRQKIHALGLQKHIELLKGDSETIFFNDSSFDAVTVAFGVRNFENLELGLTEIKRVLQPGGKLVVLEFSRPDLPIAKRLYNFYLNSVAPRIGRMISKNKNAYQYLNDSVQKFPDRKTFIDILLKLGYKNTSYKTLTLGICSIYCAEK